MCSHIVRVKYKAQGESPQMMTFDTSGAALERIAELQKLDTIAEIKLFGLVGVTRRTETWTGITAP